MKQIASKTLHDVASQNVKFFMHLFFCGGGVSDFMLKQLCKILIYDFNKYYIKSSSDT
jgi:hypothetical protein